MKIALIPTLTGSGGPSSFYQKFKAGLIKEGWSVTADPLDPGVGAVLVIAGSRRLWDLYQLRRRGIPIIQRLDGLHWIHRRIRTGIRHALRSELNNLDMAFIRRYLADQIVYQSQFSRDWWLREYGDTAHRRVIIPNGVDLEEYNVKAFHAAKEDAFVVLVVEGALQYGNELGLGNAAAVCARLSQRMGKRIHLRIAAKVPDHVRRLFGNTEAITFEWLNTVKREEIPNLHHHADLYFSAELNPACPNAVIEALACGSVVAGFDTGALTELVPMEVGLIAPYGADVWKMQKADPEPLAWRIVESLRRLDDLRKTSRHHAASRFGLDAMVRDYIQVIQNA